MQIVHASLGPGEGKQAISLLKSLGIKREYYKLISSESGDLLIINSLYGNVDELIDSLNSSFDFQNNSEHSLVLFTADTVIPRNLKKTKEAEFRSSRESLITYAEDKSEIDLQYLLMVLFSGIISSLGLILDNIAVIVGAMIIAPVLGPILAITIGIVLADISLVKKGIKAEIIAVLIAVIVGVIFGLFVPNTGITDSLVTRMQPSIADLLIALAAGGAGAYSLVKGQIETGLVGVMIAASLIPVMSTIGIGISLGYNEMIFGSSLLLVGNYLALLLINIITFYLKGLKPQIWFKNRAERIIKKSLIFIILSVILLSVPLGILTFYQFYKEKPVEIIRETINEALVLNWNYRVEDIEIKGNLINVYLYTDTDSNVTEEVLGAVKIEIEDKLNREYNMNFKIIPIQELRL